jgi:hypothetical protein
MMQGTSYIRELANRTWIRRAFTHRRSLVVATTAVAAIAGVTAFVGATSHGGGRLTLEDARMIIEFNSTANDIGIQMFIDGEPWKKLRVFDPNGKKILDIEGKKSLKSQGLTELFFESSEPSLDEFSLEQFLHRFPEGVYEFEGVTIEGQGIDGEATFTHVIPDAPVIVSPAEGSVQNPANTIVDWDDVADPPGSAIQAYQVIVTQILDVLPKRELSLFVPASVTHVTVPAEFLVAGADYDLEVLAIEDGGNQTITTSTFSTSP